MTTATYFDLPFALSQLSNNESLLIKLLEKFSTDYSKISDELTLHVSEDEFKTAKDKAHMLKGVAGNLGMKALQLACRQLEQPLVNHTIEPNQLDEFEDVFHQTIAAVKAAIESLQTQQQDEVSSLKPEQQLIEKLKKYEFIPPDELEKLLNGLSLTSPKLGTLKQSIIDLEYDAALTILTQD